MMTQKERLKIQQANAAKARAALAAKRNGGEQPAPRWAVGVTSHSFIVFIDGNPVFSHDFKE